MTASRAATDHLLVIDAGSGVAGLTGGASAGSAFATEAAGGLMTTAAAKRYPCFGTVSIHSASSSPRAFRSVEIWKERLASSTNVSGQREDISSCLESARPGLWTSSSSTSKAFGGSGTRWFWRVRRRWPTSRQYPPNSYKSLEALDIGSPSETPSPPSLVWKARALYSSAGHR